MHSRSLLVAFLTLALSSFTAQGAPANRQQEQPGCDVPSVSTIFHTVTVTAGGAAQTSSSNNNNNGKNTNNSGSSNNNSNGSSNNNGNNGNKGSSSNNNGKNNNNSGSSSSSGSANTNKGSTTTQTNNGAVNTSSASSTNTASSSTNTGSANSGDDSAAQTSLTLDPRVIAPAFANNGQDVPTAGQVASLTSTNNFINFCLTVPNFPITNGKQITTGSCDPAPIGVIPSVSFMPSAKFVFPQNFGTVKANTAFTIQLNIQNMQTGFFVNAQENYFAAPQQLNSQGLIQGHSHVVVEALDSLTQSTPTDPQKFAFFKGLNDAAVNGQLTADVTAGLPAGVYKVSTINTSANHAPAVVPVAQHGSLDDVVYFTVTDDGTAAGGAASSSVASSVAVASSTANVGASASASVTAASLVPGKSAAATSVTGKAATTTAKAAATPTAKAPATSTAKAATPAATEKADPKAPAPAKGAPAPAKAPATPAKVVPVKGAEAAAPTEAAKGKN